MQRKSEVWLINSVDTQDLSVALIPLLCRIALLDLHFQQLPWLCLLLGHHLKDCMEQIAEVWQSLWLYHISRVLCWAWKDWERKDMHSLLPCSHPNLPTLLLPAPLFSWSAHCFPQSTTWILRGRDYQRQLNHHFHAGSGRSTQIKDILVLTIEKKTFQAWANFNLMYWYLRNNSAETCVNSPILLGRMLNLQHNNDR